VGAALALDGRGAFGHTGSWHAQRRIRPLMSQLVTNTDGRGVQRRQRPERSRTTTCGGGRWRYRLRSARRQRPVPWSFPVARIPSQVCKFVSFFTADRLNWSAFRTAAAVRTALSLPVDSTVIQLLFRIRDGVDRTRRTHRLILFRIGNERMTSPPMQHSNSASCRVSCATSSAQ
jgi:hypothetical protein